MAAHFYEYLEFNSEEDRENQLDVYVAYNLALKRKPRLKQFHHPATIL